MLKKSHISNIQIYTNDWDAARCGRFTSSRIYPLLGDSLNGTGALSYIYQKVGEFITGKPSSEDDQIEDENTEWGRTHEPAAIKLFGMQKGIDFLVTQKIILNPEGRFSSTPDAIWVHGESVLKNDEYNVSTLEVKCPRKFPRFIPLHQCDTPADLKKYSKQYYWQVMHQMYICDSAVGYFMCYHPLFPEGKNFKIIQFNKIDLWDDFKLLDQRMKQVEVKFWELRNQYFDI